MTGWGCTMLGARLRAQQSLVVSAAENTGRQSVTFEAADAAVRIARLSSRTSPTESACRTVGAPVDGGADGRLGHLGGKLRGRMRLSPTA